MTATMERPIELAGASTDELADALAQRIESLDPHHLLDAFAAAQARYWRRRAERFEAARPVPGGYYGAASRKELSARWGRLTSLAQACRNRATYAELYGPTDADLALFVSVAAGLEVGA